MRYWRIRIGLPQDPDRFVLIAYKRGYVAIGWNELGDISALESEEELKRLYEKIYGEAPSSPEVRTIWDFVKVMDVGDIVLLPNLTDERRVYVGEVVGPYVHRTDWRDACFFANRRRVRWFAELDWDLLSERLRAILGTPGTLINIDRYSSDIEFYLML